MLSLPVGKLFDEVGYQEIFLIMASIVVITLIFGYFSPRKKHPQQKGGNELMME